MAAHVITYVLVGVADLAAVAAYVDSRRNGRRLDSLAPASRAGLDGQSHTSEVSR